MIKEMYEVALRDYSYYKRYDKTLCLEALLRGKTNYFLKSLDVHPVKLKALEDELVEFILLAGERMYQDVLKTLKKCNCSVKLLMTKGCQCGGN